MKKLNNIATIGLLVLSVLLIGYGVYAVITAANYVTSYTAASTMTTKGMIEYIVTSSMAYFGFGFTLLAMSLVINNQNKILSIRHEATVAYSKDSSHSSPSSKDVPVTKQQADENMVKQDNQPANISETPIASRNDNDNVDNNVSSEVDESVSPAIDEETGKPEFEVEYIYEEDQAETPELAKSTKLAPVSVSRPSTITLPEDISQEIENDMLFEIA